MYDNLRNINTAHHHNTTLPQRGGYVQPKPRTNALTRAFRYRCVKAYSTLPTSITTTNHEVCKTKLREWVKAQKEKKIATHFMVVKMKLIFCFQLCFDLLLFLMSN